ncbi:hypothetical protein G6F68_017706 [Rhizopus microsporus]|nr:hypothetical protein G6F68_017706 [Rhizopus microsporus]
MSSATSTPRLQAAAVSDTGSSGSTPYCEKLDPRPASTRTASSCARAGRISTAPSNTATREAVSSSRTVKRVPSAWTVPCRVRTRKGRGTAAASGAVAMRISPARRTPSRSSCVIRRSIAAPVDKVMCEPSGSVSARISPVPLR